MTALQMSIRVNFCRYGRILKILGGNNPRGQKRAAALLSWIALADRPLKTYEVLDGIVLCKEPFILNQSTKLASEELARYKPLIEIDASGNVSFVHFSVKQ